MSDRKTLTFISPRFLFPTDSGGKIRTTQVLRGLRDGEFNICLVMPSTDADRTAYAAQIDAICDELVTWEKPRVSKILSIIKKLAWSMDKYPIPVRSDWDPAGARVVQSALEQESDIVVFDFPHSVILAPDKIATSSVLFTHNIEAEIFHRHWQVARFPPYKWLWRNQYKKMHRFERAALSRFDTVIAVSDRDRQFFQTDYEIDHCRTIPTGVDTEYFCHAPPADKRQIVFCGSMDWMANIDGIEYFFEQVWPLVHRKAPDARMKVVGRAPPENLVKRIQAESPEWTFTGFVDDVREHICGTAAFVIPLRVGGGTRIKAFEAMAMGVPVVSTSIGIEGLPVQDGDHFLAADDPTSFAEHVCRLIDDEGLRMRISKCARSLVEEQYGFRRVAAEFQDICLETVSRQQAPRSQLS